MGMTIDEATLYMELYKRKLFDSVSDIDKDIEAYDTAIEIMCKYQEIERIIRNYDTAWEFHQMKSTIDKIREVIEDGKNT